MHSYNHLLNEHTVGIGTYTITHGLKLTIIYRCGRIGRRKLKKKALAMRREASGTGGGPNSRQTLTASEQRVLGLMGLTAVIGQVGIMERGFDVSYFLCW